MQAIINIDIISNKTYEILEMIHDEWLGDYQNILENIKARYSIADIKIDKDTYSIYVEG